MPSKRPTHAEQLAAIKRPDDLVVLHSQRARLVIALRNLYGEHQALLATHNGSTGPAYGQAAALLRELEPKGEAAQ